MPPADCAPRAGLKARRFDPRGNPRSDGMGARQRSKSRLADPDIGQNCCWNATPADNISRNGHNAQKVGRCLSFLLHRLDGPFQIAARLRNLAAVVTACPWGPGIGLINVMGIVMKKMVLVAATLAMTAGSALAADMAVKAVRPPPPPPFEPWDFAFGSALMNDYIFRGVTQSNHKPSVAAYFEPRYNFTKDVQIYVGTSFESISFPNRAAAEVDIYGGIRPTFGMFAFDFGVWGYLYPGGTCYNAFAFPGSGIPGSSVGCVANADPVTLGLPINGNFAKKSASFYEGYAKVNVTLNDMFSIGANEYYSPNFLNLGAWGNYASITGKFTAPSSTFGSTGIGMYISGEFGRQWLGTSDRFYGTQIVGQVFQFGIPEPSYNTWNIGVGFTYKVFTLDLRYSDTNLSKGNCNAFTSDYSTTNSSPGFVTAINPSGFGSNWCSPTGVVKFSADLTAMTNLK